MVYCDVCKNWVLPIQWVDSTFSGHWDLREACPSCRETLQHAERPAART